MLLPWLVTSTSYAQQMAVPGLSSNAVHAGHANSHAGLTYTYRKNGVPQDKEKSKNHVHPSISKSVHKITAEERENYVGHCIDRVEKAEIFLEPTVSVL